MDVKRKFYSAEDIMGLYPTTKARGLYDALLQGNYDLARTCVDTLTVREGERLLIDTVVNGDLDRFRTVLERLGHSAGQSVTDVVIEMIITCRNKEFINILGYRKLLKPSAKRVAAEVKVDVDQCVDTVNHFVRA